MISLLTFVRVPLICVDPCPSVVLSPNTIKLRLLKPLRQALKPLRNRHARSVTQVPLCRRNVKPVGGAELPHHKSRQQVVRTGCETASRSVSIVQAAANATGTGIVAVTGSTPAAARMPLTRSHVSIGSSLLTKYAFPAQGAPGCRASSALICASAALSM